MRSAILFFAICLPPLCAQEIFFSTNYAPVPTVATPTDTNSGGSCTGSSPAWTCSGATSVTLSDSTSGASILYTTDGSTPACPSTGTTYSSAISVSATTTIKAIGCKTAYNASSVLSTAYTIVVAPSVLHTWSANGTSTSVVVDTTAGATPTGGGTMFLAFGGSNAFGVPSCTAITDNKSGSWVEDNSYLNGGANSSLGAIKLCRRTTTTTADITTVTLTTVLGDYSTVIAWETSNLNATPLDLTVAGNDSGFGTTSWATGATGSTMAVSGEIMFGVALDFRVTGSTDTWTPGAGWTSLATKAGPSNNLSLYVEYKIASSTASGQTAPGTVSATSTAQVISTLNTYKPQ